jgi:hypothetical protein
MGIMYNSRTGESDDWLVDADFFVINDAVASNRGQSGVGLRHAYKKKDCA